MSQTENAIQDFSQEFDPSKIRFSEPEVKKIPQNDADIAAGKPAQVYYHSDIQYEYSNGEVADLMFVSPRLFTFGPQGKADIGGKMSFQLCLALSKNGTEITEEEQAFIDAIEGLYTATEDAVFNMRKAVKKSAGSNAWKTKEGMRLKHPIYYKTVTVKRDDGEEDVEIDTSVSGKLYVKISATNKVRGPKGKAGKTGHWRSITLFEDNDGVEISDPLETEAGEPGQLLDQRGYATCAIKISHVYIGDKPSLQMRLQQVRFEPQEMSKRRYLPPVKTTNRSSKDMLGDDDSQDYIEEEMTL